MNLKTVGISMGLFIILAIAMSMMTSRGLDKVEKRMKDQEEKAAGNRETFKTLVEEDLRDMGASEGALNSAATIPPGELEGDFGVVKTRQLRPSGKWMGIRKGTKNNIAFIKFDSDQYWLKSKDDLGNEIREHGRYEYQITNLFFYPNGGGSYSLEYYMVSNDCIELSGYDNFYRFERSSDFDLNF